MRIDQANPDNSLYLNTIGRKIKYNCGGIAEAGPQPRALPIIGNMSFYTSQLKNRLFVNA
jgi:hypothetical protein